jgi:hypothetical protein
VITYGRTVWFAVTVEATFPITTTYAALVDEWAADRTPLIDLPVAVVINPVTYLIDR